MLKNLVYIVVLTTIIVISWVVFGIYHNYTTSTINSDASILITPIPGKFDDETLSKIAGRRAIPVNLSEKRVEATEAAKTETTTVNTQEASSAAQL